MQSSLCFSSPEEAESENVAMLPPTFPATDTCIGKHTPALLRTLHECGVLVNQVFGWMDDIPPVESNADSSSSGLKVLNVNATLLLLYEEKRDKLQTDILELERKAEDVFTSLTNYIRFLILLNGAGVILQSRNLSCKCAAFMVTPILMIPLVIGASHAIYVAYIKLKRLSPSREMLTSTRSQLANGAERIHNYESSRIAGEIRDETRCLVLHPTEDAESVVTRSRAIMNLKKLSKIEEGYAHLIFHAICNGIIYVGVVCSLVYFTYCAEKGLDGVWRMNPMMPHNPLQPR